MEIPNLVSVVLQYLSRYHSTNDPQAFTGINLGELWKVKTNESQVMCISDSLEMSRQL